MITCSMPVVILQASATAASSHDAHEDDGEADVAVKALLELDREWRGHEAAGKRERLVRRQSERSSEDRPDEQRTGGEDCHVEKERARVVAQIVAVAVDRHGQCDCTISTVCALSTHRFQHPA